MNAPTEVSASNSQAVLLAEITDLRKALRDLIVAGKQVLIKLPADARPALLDPMLKAEDLLK